MKTYSLICLAVVLTGIFSACHKTATEPLTEAAATQQLVQSKDFTAFATDFIPDMVNMMNYHRNNIKSSDRKGFLKQVEQAGTDLHAVGTVYSSYQLDFNQALLLKNRIDNDLLHVLNKHPFLLQFGDEQIRNVLMTALDQGIRSQAPDWEEARKQINLKLNSNGTVRTLNGVGVNKYNSELTINEAWECLLKSVGAGGASIWGIEKLKKAAMEGLQEIVLTTSKFLAKYAGWIGAAVMVFELSSCLYTEATD
jgi:hypothetical protein